MIYSQLFWTFFKIGLFNFGGGYAMISFLQNEVVYKQAWLSTAQFTDIVAISQVTPGPVGINMATFAGYTASGSVWGALVATVAVCLPSLILLVLAAHYLFATQNKFPAAWRLLRLTVIGLIAAAALTLCNAQNFVDYKSVLLCAGAFVAVWKFKRGPITVLLAGAVLGLLLY